MSFFRIITSNHIANVGFVAFFAAQLLKVLFTLVFTRRLVWERMVGAGGMPSSHAALTISICIAMEAEVGLDSPLLGLTLAFTAIVLYDAMGVRRAAGEQAKVLNRIVFEFLNLPIFAGLQHEQKDDAVYESEAAEDLDDASVNATDITDDTQDPMPLLNKELKEFLGHTPLEVLGGCMVGILVAVFMRTA
jgi:acid phosphatase family membrane protein YuiD